VERVRPAVIGAGLVGAKHVTLVRTSEACVLVGVCDTEPNRRAAVERPGVPFYQRAEELRRREAPDGAIIATPNNEHVPVTVACAGGRSSARLNVARSGPRRCSPRECRLSGQQR